MGGTLELFILAQKFRPRGRSQNFQFLVGNASLFTKVLFTIFVPLNPPPPKQQSEGFPLEFLLKEPQTELRTLSQNCEQTLQKLRTNRILNKRASLNFRTSPEFGRSLRDFHW